MFAKNRVVLLFVCGSLWLNAAAQAPKPFLHALFSNDMILQRDVPCPVWGWTEPGTQVTVTLGEQTVTATADQTGKWLAKIGPRPAGGPHTLTIAGPRPVTLKNVLFGDVWICSGQSNMDFGIDGVDQWWNEVPGAPVDGVRLFWVTPTSSFTPEANAPGSWSVASRDGLLKKKSPFTTGGFSAIAWMFGRAVNQKSGVPVGMIECAQGNTSIQPWSTLASLRQEPRYGADFDPLASYRKELLASLKACDPAWPQNQAWIGAEFDDSGWSQMDLPQDWSRSALPGFGGAVWFRRQVELPADWAGRDLWLSLGPVNDQEITWFNGEFLGGQDGYRRDHAFPVPGALVKAGRNTIAIRVQGDRGFVGKAELMTLSRGPAPADTLKLAGPWRYQTGTPGAKLTGRKRLYDRIWVPASLYQGMVAPLAPFAIKGVLWYQGEGNAGQVAYGNQLTALIRDWRATFGQGDFSFYIVQLSAFGRPLPAPGESSWAVTREIQAQVAAAVPRSGLAVSIDRGEIGNIHPPNKRDVAERLAAVALARDYGFEVPCEGPTYRAMKVAEGRAILSFDHAQGLKSLGAGPTGFAIAGADRKFVWAQARIEGETVAVWSPEIGEPVAVRYAWADYPVCNLYNEANLPAVPFRTDTWGAAR